jgi:antitoxin FitA
MSLTMVQIRNVPSDFHRRLKARAAMEGMSMSDYILREVGKSLDKPTRRDVLNRIRARGTDRTISSVKVIGEERTSR